MPFGPYKPWAQARGLRAQRPPRDPCHPASPRMHHPECATPLEPGCVQLVCHVTVPQLALGAFIPHRPCRTGSRSCAFRPIEALGASPGTAGTKATPRSMPPRVTSPASPRPRHLESATPLEPGCVQLVGHATVPQLALGAFIPYRPCRTGLQPCRTGLRTCLSLACQAGLTRRVVRSRPCPAGLRI